jgi:hypothetical protein
MEGSTLISEFSVPVSFYAPLGKNSSLSFYMAQATAAGDSLKKLGGFGDPQLTLGHYFEPLRMNFSLGVNLPLGRKKLTYEEFGTLYQLSLSAFRFQTPSFGQGLNVSPGVAWAIPLNELFVVGLGASYQYRGPFQPFEVMVGKYDPGDEWVVTGGLDVRLSQNTLLTADYYTSFYQTDKLNQEAVYQAGKKQVVSVQFKYHSGFKSLWVFWRYRTREKNQVAIAGGLLPENEKSQPDETELSGVYRFRPGERQLFITLFLDGRFLRKTSVFDKTTLTAVGLMPEVTVSEKVKLPVSLKYINGKYGSRNITGFEASLGMIYEF